MRLRPTIRLRLAVWYAALFLASGAVLLGVSYAVVREQFEPQVEARSGAAPDPSGQVVRAPRAAAIERRVREEERRRDEEALRDVLGWFGAALGLVTLGSAAAGWLVAGRALAPVSRITATAQRVSAESLHERIALEGPPDELKEIADTFDAMLARLDATFDSHRRFVANASHELRTPLAIMRAELEELAEVGTLSAEQQAMVANARRAAARSERLIDSLLTLARSEGRLDRRTRVDLADLVRQALDPGRARAVGIVVRADLQPAEVEGDPVLLHSLVANLVENGLRHNEAGGVLDVATRPAQLVVANSGPVLEAGEVEELFQPFARRSRTADGGSGLGLSIVRAVAHAHDGSATAQPRDGGGLVVTVRLPASSGTP